MTESNHLYDRWEHTIVQVFKHDSKFNWNLVQTMDHFQKIGKF